LKAIPDPAEKKLMNSQQRFLETMRYGKPDHVPYFEEGIRKGVIKAWHRQGLPRNVDLARLFPCDLRIELNPDLYPLPRMKEMPLKKADLKALKRRLNPWDKRRLPLRWKQDLEMMNEQGAVRMLEVHEGFFLTMGVGDWQRFIDVMYMIKDDPEMVHEIMRIQAEFAAEMAQRILSQTAVEAVIFSEPIGGNNGPIISPKTYEEFVLQSYQPILDVIRAHHVEVIIVRTYANARVLIPSLIKWGLNCLWACEVNTEAMNYADLRGEFGRDLRLIGGIDLDTLREDKAAIRQEIESKVPALLKEGGYIPLADGRVREDVPFENYVYYRELLKEIIGS
jgi:hypothetical protein